MSDLLETLQKARINLIKMRRSWADVLAKPFERGKTEQAVTQFIELQNAIEAVDAAIEGEEGDSPSVYEQDRD